MVCPPKNWPKHSWTKSNRLSSMGRVQVKKSRFSEEKIIQVLKASENGVPVDRRIPLAV